MIELKEERESYVCQPAVAAQLPGEHRQVTIFTAINRQGTVFLWPVPLPGADGKVLEWHRSAQEAAERTMHPWIRMRADMSLGAYQLYEALGELSEPTWPDASLSELLTVAFSRFMIDSLDHPVVQRLRGQV
jgi:hypothetical protein